MEHRVKRLLGSNPTVSFRCAKCRANLDAPLTDAGSEDTCPKCGSRVLVPGEAELQERRERLEAIAKERAAEASKPPQPQVVAAAAPKVPAFICPNPNCGYKGSPVRKARGSIIIAIFLLCVGVLPGILYLLFAGGYDYFCPQCHMKQPGDLIAL